MNKFVRNILSVSVLSLMLCGLLGVGANVANAQIRLRFSGQTVSISDKSNADTVLAAIQAIVDGKASLVIPGSQLKKSTIALKVGTKKIVAKKGRLAAGGNLIKLSRNTKTQGLTNNLLEALGELLSNLAGQSPNPTPTPNTIKVAKPYSVTYCEEADIPVEELDHDLIKRGVTIYDKQCAWADGLNSVQKCGSKVQMYRVLQIDASKIIWAVLAGFTPVDRMSQSLSIVSCNPSGIDTIEMVGVITNIACKTTENTADNFDERLKNAGLNVLEASCSAEDKVACGEISNLYRVVKIKRSQRGLALALGLKDKKDFGGEIKFGLACPPPLVVDEDFETTEMIGILFYKACPITENLVEDLDNRMVNGGLTILSSSCGLHGNLDPLLECPIHLRFYKIPKNQELLAVRLGLYYRHELKFPILYGQSCPK